MEGEGTYILAYTKSSLKDDGSLSQESEESMEKNLSDEKVLRNSELTLHKNSYGEQSAGSDGKRYYISMKPIQLWPIGTLLFR